MFVSSLPNELLIAYKDLYSRFIQHYQDNYYVNKYRECVAEINRRKNN